MTTPSNSLALTVEEACNRALNLPQLSNAVRLNYARMAGERAILDVFSAEMMPRLDELVSEAKRQCDGAFTSVATYPPLVKREVHGWLATAFVSSYVRTATELILREASKVMQRFDEARK